MFKVVFLTILPAFEMQHPVLHLYILMENKKHKTGEQTNLRGTGENDTLVVSNIHKKCDKMINS